MSLSNWYMHVFTGDYTCSAVNLVGSDEAEVSLHVVGESISWTHAVRCNYCLSHLLNTETL